MPPPCCVMDSCTCHRRWTMCQENDLIRGESPWLFKCWNYLQSLFHHLHCARPAAACGTLLLKSDDARWWFTRVEFKPIAARYVSQREASGCSCGQVSVTHGAGGGLCFGCSQRFRAFSQYRLFQSTKGQVGSKRRTHKQQTYSSSGGSFVRSRFSVKDKRCILMVRVAATSSYYLHAEHRSSAGSPGSFPHNLTRKQWIANLIEYD